MHQTVSGIVNKYQKAAFWRTAFKPVMVGAIDLDKFAQAIADGGLVNSRLTTGMWNSEPVRRDLGVDGLGWKPDTLALPEFFCGQCGTKVTVVFTYQREYPQFE